MKFSHILSLGLLVALASCSKDKSAENHHQNNDTASYQPMTAGSSWHYTDASNPDAGFTLTSTGRDTVVGGMSYYIFDNKPDTSDSPGLTLFAQHGHNYYTIGLIGELGSNTLLYLKDTTLNVTWSQNMYVTMPGLGNIMSTLDFQLTGVNTTLKVNGKTFKSVDVVTMQLKEPNPIGGGPITYATAHIYFARGIGVIKVSLDENGSPVSDFTLDSYTIH